MRFLCLHGAFGNAKNFEIQLAPFCKDLISDGTASFFFTQGTIQCFPPPGFEDYFGPGPSYRFIETQGTTSNDVLDQVRDFPEGDNAEDVCRKLLPSKSPELRKSMRAALDEAYRTMEEHGPFDGICAYSEGAIVAGTLILDELRRFELEGRPRQIKRAIFFSGWPPLNIEADEVLVLADTCDDVIDIPTLHCIGVDDPYLDGSMALYNVCDQDEATLFDHGKGHTIPRDAQTLQELGDAVRALDKAGNETVYV